MEVKKLMAWGFVKYDGTRSSSMISKTQESVPRHYE